MTEAQADVGNTIIEDAYERGYGNGQDAAYEELVYHDRASHAATCGCRPCRTWDGIRSALMVRDDDDDDGANDDDGADLFVTAR